MNKLLGILAVFGCVGVSHIVSGGSFALFWQPAEYLVIVGASLGAFVIANPSHVIGRTLITLKAIFSAQSATKKQYVDLLCLQFTLFKVARTKGILALESHIDKPQQSSVFRQYPSVMQNGYATRFLCDYLRLLTMGSENVYQMEDLMSEEIELYKEEEYATVAALSQTADGMPALGIVAAVLGIIHTMGFLNEPPSVIGHAIGAALVGTFAGIILAYGLMYPISEAARSVSSEKIEYLNCVKAGMVAYLQGHPPIVAVDYARKSTSAHVRPTFFELEEIVLKIGDVKL